MMLEMLYDKQWRENLGIQIYKRQASKLGSASDKKNKTEHVFSH